MIKKTRKQTEIHFKNPMYPQGPDPYSLIRFQQGDKMLQLSCSFSLIFTRTEDEGVCACMKIAAEITQASHHSVIKKNTRISTLPCIIFALETSLWQKISLFICGMITVCVCVCACMVLNRSW